MTGSGIEHLLGALRVVGVKPERALCHGLRPVPA
ncbi:MAG: hypothetical protein H6Q91_1977 [Deltaproteobacteria bacterium]|nr:hypothetical protein [Deltaproteobacteria bacterium]